MQNVNTKIQSFLEKHKIEQRYLFILFLLSVIVVVTVILSLVTPAMSMTGDPVCGKEEHTHSEQCYSDVLICTENTDGHQHNDDCYTTETKIICGLEEDENHTHSDECYSEEKTLICDIPESPVHTHTDECYEHRLTCEKEEHTHTDECYETPPSETNSTEPLTNESDEKISQPENQDIITIDPIDAEMDAILNSIRKSKSIRSVSGYAVNGSVTVIDEISVDFGNYIKNISQKEVAGTVTQENVKTIKFTINYNLPENTLMNNSENRQIHCLLPDNVIITDERSGIVRKEGQEIGTYKITNDGYIIIDFDQNFVKDGSTAITGDISFNANVIKTNENSNYETVTIGKVSVNIPFLSETTTTNDLSVNKTFMGYDRSTKKVSYKIDISSYNGSGDGDITVTDMLYYTDSTLIHLDWQDGDTVTFTKNDGSSITGTVQIAEDGTATITGLPKLEANESYSLEYTATLTPDSQTQIIKTNNKVTVSNGTLSDEAIYYGQTAVSCGITKKGQYNDRTDMVEWTINITNPFGDSLDGYTITDDMLGLTVNGLTIKDGNGNAETLNELNGWSGTTGSLDTNTNTFSFNASSSASSYTLTYQTKLPDRSAIANNAVSNKAILKNTDIEISAPTADAWISADRQGVSKRCNSAVYDADGNIILGWYVALDFQTGDFNSQTYKDTMSADNNYHYMSPLQKDTLKLLGYKADNTEVTLVKDTDYTVKWYNADGNEITSDTEDVYSFEITFADNTSISELSDIDIYYSATGITENMSAGSDRVYKNTADFAGIESSAEYWERKKEPFYKYDCSVEGQYSNAAETTHNANDLSKNENGDLILKWYIDANESNYFPSDTDAVLTDTLPAGTVLNEASIRYGDWSQGYYSLVENHSMTWTIAQNENGQQVVVFTVPASQHNGKQFRIDYEVTVSMDYILANRNARGNAYFLNTITDGSYTAEQTQVIERTLIEKNGSDPANSFDGYINYTIDVNPYAELLSNNGKLTLTDTINYQYNTFVPTLVEIKVYSVTKDENDIELLTELDPTEYTLTYSNDGINAKFTIGLPDKTHLKIKYRYHCVYKNPEWFEPVDSGVDIFNSAVIEFDNFTQTATHNEKYYLNNQSEAHAVTDDYLKIEKIDAENYGIKLSGAEFALYKWDGTIWQAMTDVTSTEDGGKEPVWGAENAEPYKMATDSSGKAMLPAVESGVLYKIVEQTAPTDYIKSILPHYFAEDSVPASLPADVKSADVKMLLKGGIISIPNNKMQKTEVEVVKYWHDPPGFTGEHGDVEVELFQSKKDPSGKINGPEVTVNFSDASGASIVKVFNVERGFFLNLQILAVNSWHDNGYIKVNGNDINFYYHPEFPNFNWSQNSFEYRDDSYYTEYQFILTEITEDTVIDIHFGKVSEGKTTDYKIYIAGVEVGVPVTGIPDDAVSVGTATLNSGNNWTYVWDNIPATDEFGYNYYYYVQENTTIATYTPQYENNGANKGTIYLTNTGEGYTNKMPSTGGTGCRILIGAGTAFLSGSALIHILSKRRNRRRKTH